MTKKTKKRIGVTPKTELNKEHYFNKIANSYLNENYRTDRDKFDLAYEFLSKDEREHLKELIEANPIKQSVELLRSSNSYRLFLEMNGEEYDILIRTREEDNNWNFDWEIYDDRELTDEEFEMIEDYLYSDKFELEDLE